MSTLSTSELNQLFTALNQRGQGEASVAAALAAALPAIAQHVPSLGHVAVQRYVRSGLSIWYPLSAGDADDQTITALQELPQHRHVIQEAEPQTLDDGTYLLPLKTHSTTYGVLEIRLQAAQPATDAADDIPEWLPTLAQQIALLIESRQLASLLQRQVRLSGEINATTRLEEIAGLVGRAILQPGQFITVMIFQRDDNDEVSDLRVLASANREQNFASDERIPLADDDLEAAFRRINGSSEIIIDLQQQHPLVTEALHAWLSNYGIRALYIVPLRTAGRTYGTLTMNDRQYPISLTPAERQVFRSLADQVAVAIENQNLLSNVQANVEQTRQQVRVLQLLNEIASSEETEQDEATLLQRGAVALVNATSFDHVGISMLEADSQSSILRADYPNTDSLGLRLETNQAIASQMRQNNEPLAITDIANDPRIQSANRQAMLRMGIKATLFLPMFDLQGELLGVVGLDSYRALTAFSEQDTRLAKTIVSQLVISLQRLRLLASSQRQAAQMQQITLFSQAVQASLDIEEILETTTTASQQVLPFDYMTIRLLDPAADATNTADTSGLIVRKRYLADRLGVDTEPARPGLTSQPHTQNTVVATAWQTQQLVEVDDLQNPGDEGGSAWQHPYQHVLRSMMALPITSRGQRLGLIEIGKREAYAYLPTDRAALVQLANQLAVTLTNAEAYTRSSHLALNKALTSEIAAKLQQQLDIPTIMTLTARELGQALGAKRARIRLGLEQQPNRQTSDG